MNDHHHLIRNMEFLEHLRKQHLSMAQMESFLKYQPIDKKLGLDITIQLYKLNVVKDSDFLTNFVIDHIIRIPYFAKIQTILKPKLFKMLLQKIKYKDL
jgi:hypothetical protein